MANEIPDIEAILDDIRRSFVHLFPERHEEIARWFERLVTENGRKELAEALESSRREERRLAEQNARLNEAREAAEARAERAELSVRSSPRISHTGPIELLVTSDDEFIDPEDIPRRR